MIQCSAFGLLISAATATLTLDPLHATQRTLRILPGNHPWNAPTYTYGYPVLAHQSQQHHSYADHPQIVLPPKFEVTPEDVSSGVSGFLHNSVSPNTAWYWVRGQKWKWNYIHSALHATGLQALSQYAPYAPTWENGFPPRPVDAGPVVQVLPLGLYSVPGIGQFITGPSFVLHKKKK